MSEATIRGAARIAGELDAAARLSFEAWNVTLRANLGQEVEIRHDPPVPALDGWRDRENAAEYLEQELVAFPRAFRDDFQVRIETRVENSDLIRTEVAYEGTLVPDGPQVAVGFTMAVVVRDDAVVCLDAGSLPETRKQDLVAWLKAVEAAGGFDPPAPQRT
jgi:hypothetical protein